jgi:hypothetical protein
MKTVGDTLPSYEVQSCWAALCRCPGDKTPGYPQEALA